MNEKEKMLAGELYDANNNEELIKERYRAKDQCYDYNRLRPSDHEGKKRLIKEILGKTGQVFTIEQPFMCDYGYHIKIGEYFYSNHNLMILDDNTVQFGDHVFIGPNCSFYTASHPFDAQRRNQGLEYAKPIYVGNHVWIGGNVTVLPGVTIGDHVVIGAGSVVTKDIPSYTAAAGNPCRVIKKIEEQERKEDACNE